MINKEDMITYQSKRKVKAVPMSRGEFCDYVGMKNQPDEDADESGFLVEFDDGRKPNKDGHDGYVSWMDKAQFENGFSVYTGILCPTDAADEESRVKSALFEMQDFTFTEEYKKLDDCEKVQIAERKAALRNYLTFLQHAPGGLYYYQP